MDSGAQQTPDPLPYIAQLVERCSVGITPILVNNWRIPKWQGVGSAFVLMESGQPYLVTASHVVDCAFQNKEVIAKIFGTVVHLHGLYFASDAELDIAVTWLPQDWLASYGITELYAPSADRLPSIYQSTGTYILMGFPAAYNQIDLRWSSGPTKAAWLTARRSETPLTSTRIPSAICLDYDPKTFKPKNPPGLHGMSGGLLLELMSRRLDHATTGLSLYPAGVLCEWHKRSKAVVALPIESVVRTIRARSRLWALTAELHAKPFPSL